MEKGNKNKGSREYPINDACSFTHFDHPNYGEKNYTTITSDRFVKTKKRRVVYAIHLDWLQIVCENKMDMNFNNYKDDNILIIKSERNNNSNFNRSYDIILNNETIIQLFCNPRNKHIYKKTEVMLRIENKLLYDTHWNTIITEIINRLSLKFIRIVRLDIALDSDDLIKQLRVFWRCKHTKTVVKSNKGLRISGDDNATIDSTITGYTIGSAKSAKYASIYNKSNEITESSSKLYIKEYWALNGLNTDKDIGRFELRLENKVIRKYSIDSLMDITTGFLGGVLKEEVTNWLRFYKIRCQDRNLRKADAIMKKTTEEIEFIQWKYLPTQVIRINHDNYSLMNPINVAKRSITFFINDLTRNESNITSTHPYIIAINHTMEKYGLKSFTLRKMDEVLKRFNNPETNALYGYSLMLKQINVTNQGVSGDVQ